MRLPLDKPQVGLMCFVNPAFASRLWKTSLARSLELQHDVWKVFTGRSLGLQHDTWGQNRSS